MPITDELKDDANRVGLAVLAHMRKYEFILPEYLNPAQAAQFTGFTVKALERMRQRGEGPAYLKVGKSIRYAVVDLRTWMEAGRVEQG